MPQFKPHRDITGNALGCNDILMVLLVKDGFQRNCGEKWWFGGGGCVAESGDMD